MLPITGDDRESVLDRRCGDQCIGKPDSELTGDTSTTLGNSTIHRELAERGKKPNGEVSSSVAGDELRPRDHGVMHPMTSRSQLDRAAKMVIDHLARSMLLTTCVPCGDLYHELLSGNPQSHPRRVSSNLRAAIARCMPLIPSGLRDPKVTARR